LFPFGWGEINGTHNRTNFDLSRHQEFSNRKMYYFDQNTNEKYIPYIIESTYGLDRTILALICECLHKYIDENGKERIVFDISNDLAPIKVNVLPLDKKKHSERAIKIYEDLRTKLMVYYDDKGTIGKRYKNGDAIGVPFAICVDDETLNNNTVTIRNINNKEQIIVSTDNLDFTLKRKLTNKK
jgi:glycyl-tRNA synthetase